MSPYDHKNPDLGNAVGITAERKKILAQAYYPGDFETGSQFFEAIEQGVNARDITAPEALYIAFKAGVFMAKLGRY